MTALKSLLYLMLTAGLGAAYIPFALLPSEPHVETVRMPRPQNVGKLVSEVAARQDGQPFGHVFESPSLSGHDYTVRCRFFIPGRPRCSD